MAIADTDYARRVGNIEMGRADSESSWVEPARLSDYLVFLAMVMVSFSVLGAGFWAVFSHYYSA